MTGSEMLILGLLIGLIVMVFVLLRGRVSADKTAENESIAELRGQLSQLATAASGQQQTLSSQLHEQSKKLEDQLGNLRQQMGQTLHVQTQTTNENLTKLSERLAVID